MRVWGDDPLLLRPMSLPRAGGRLPRPVLRRLVSESKKIRDALGSDATGHSSTPDAVISSSLFNFRHQRRQSHVKPGGDPTDIDEADVAPPTLDVRHVGPVDAH